MSKFDYWAHALVFGLCLIAMVGIGLLGMVGR